MSAIDSYLHKNLGYIQCPSTFDLVYASETRNVGIYQLEEFIPTSEISFDGNPGDIIVGGGRGEASSLRISYPLAFNFFGEHNQVIIDSLDDVFKTFWSPTDSYLFGEGYAKLGWLPNENLDLWLAENICKLLIQHVPAFEKHRSNYRNLSSILIFNKSDNGQPLLTT